MKNKKNKCYRFALSKLECEVLFRKYYAMGMSVEMAEDRINEIKVYLNKLVKDLKAEQKNPLEIQQRFQEEFAKLCEI